MVLEQLKKLSLNELIGMLQDRIASFSRGIDKLIDKNREFNTNEIDQLRDHIKSRLQSSSERAENEKLLKLVNLFSDDKKALELIRKDVDEWLEFLDAIDEHIGADSKSLESEKLRHDITKLRNELRNVEP
jgi:predicted ribosome quality control (RQC) complex YloA/Tae2 family protein